MAVVIVVVVVLMSTVVVVVLILVVALCCRVGSHCVHVRRVALAWSGAFAGTGRGAVTRGRLVARKTYGVV